MTDKARPNKKAEMPGEGHTHFNVCEYCSKIELALAEAKICCDHEHAKVMNDALPGGNYAIVCAENAELREQLKFKNETVFDAHSRWDKEIAKLETANAKLLAVVEAAREAVGRGLDGKARFQPECEGVAQDLFNALSRLDAEQP